MAPPLPTASHSRRVHAVTFDMDGTLYSVRSHIIRIGWRLLPHHRLMRAWEDAVAGLRGRREPAMRAVAVARMAAALRRPEAEVAEELTFVLEKVWTASLTPAHRLPGILEALALLDEKGIPRSVASDHPPAERLRRLGVPDGWTTLESGEELGAFKPLPDVLTACADKMGVDPSKILHIGDRPDTDGEAARAAGALFLQVGGKGVATSRLRQILESMIQL